MTIDTDAVLAIARLRDPLGILSVYADASPERGMGRDSVAAVAVRNGLRELEEATRRDGPRERWASLRELLGRLEPELSALLDPSAQGRGRALFARLADGEVRTVGVQLALPTRVVLEETAYVRPLVAALEAGRPAGLVTVSRSAVRTHEWRLGLVEELDWFELEEDTDSWRRKQGPAYPQPGLAQQSASHEDRFLRRLERHRVRLVEELGNEVASLAADRGWERLLLAGDERLAGPLDEVLSARGADTSRTGLLLENLPLHELAERLASTLEEQRSREAAAAVERAKAATATGGAGAVGLQDVLAALAEGRVGRLLFDDGRDYRGVRAPDGRLAPAGLVPPGTEEAELAPEPYLAERMIERALETGARVTPATGAAAAGLAECDGVAAILRW